MAYDIVGIVDPKEVSNLQSLNTEIQNSTKSLITFLELQGKLKTEINKVSESQSTATEKATNYQKIIDQTAISEKKLADLKIKVEQTEKGLNDEYVKTTIRLQEANKAQKDRLKTEGLAETSLVRMRQKLAELTKEYDKAGTRTKAAAKEINDLSREIGKAEAATNRHGRGVGGYADQLGQLPGVAGRAASSIQNIVSKLAAFGPVGALIGGGLLAISAPLVAFFTKSEAGVDMLERKTAGFKAAISVLVGELIGGGEKMADAFDKPEKKASKLWTTILTALNPAWAATGAQMDIAAKSAENYTRMLQQLEDEERALIVPRAQANYKIKEAMLLYNDETKSLEQRMNGLKQAIELENQTADVEVAHQRKVVENLVLINEQKKQAGQLRDADEKKLEEARAREIDLETESLGRQTRAQKRLAAARKELQSQQEANNKKDIKAEEYKNDQIIADLKAMTNQQKKIDDAAAQYVIDNAELEYRREVNLIKATALTKEEAAKKIQELDEKNLKKTIDGLNEQLMSVRDGSAEWYKIKSDLAKAEQDLSDSTTEVILSNNEKIAESEAKNAEKKKKVFEAATQAVIDVQATLFDFMDKKYAGDLERLEQKNEAGLLSDKEYAKQKAEIELKQAKTARMQGLFNVGISTAQAIMGIWKDFPKVDFGVTAAIMTGVVAGIGLLQAGAILSQPLPTVPAFKSGIESSPSLFRAGEAGRELMLLQSGEMMMANKDTIFAGNKFKGARIFSNPQTEAIISQAEHSGFGGQSFSDNNIVSKLDSIEKAIKNKPVMIVDKESRKPIGYEENGYTQIYLDKIRGN